MATLTEMYLVPSGIKLERDNYVRSKGSVTQNLVDIIQGGTGPVWVFFNSPYKTYQWQWRRRRGYSVAGWEATPYADPEHMYWEDWSEWEDGWGFESNQQTRKQCSVQGDVACYAKDAWGKVFPLVDDIPYDISVFDQHEYQIRIRVFDESTLNVSEWGVGRVKFAACAYYDYDAITVRPDGTAYMAASDALRRAADLKIGITRDGKTLCNGYPAAYRPNLASQEIEMPASVGIEGLIGESVRVQIMGVTSIGSLAIGAARDVSVTSEPSSSTVPNPQVTLAETDDGRVKVDVPDQSYTQVRVGFTWTDLNGMTHVGEVGMTKSGSVWTGFADVPFSRKITFRCVGMRATSFGETVKDFGPLKRTFAAFGNANGDYVYIAYDLESGGDYKVNSEIVELAGRELPVSRYGDSHTHSLSVSGTLLDKNLQPVLNLRGSYLDQIELLSKPCDWTYRSPIGEYALVSVESVNYSSDKKGIVSVDISMTEVDDGVG